MKHLSIAVILFLTVIGNISAHPLSHKDDPDFIGADNFKRQFPDATAVNYKVKGEFTEVNFVWNGIQLQAFYDREGNPLATARVVERDNLPLSVQLSVKNKYADGYIAGAIEFTDVDNGLCYYVTVVNPKITFLLHVSTSGEISVFKKMKHN